MSNRVLIERLAFAAAAVLAALLATGARGEPAPLTLEQAVARAVAQNPALRGSEYLLQASRARESAAAQRPPYAVELDLEDFGGSGPLEGADALQTTLRLSGVLDLGGRRDARIAFAISGTDAASTEQRAVRLDLLAEVASRFADAAARQERLAIAQESTRLAAAMAEFVRERIRIGAAPDYELRRAEIQVAHAQIEMEHAEHELASARMRLAATWGSTEPGFERVAADLYALPPVDSFERLAERVNGNAEIQRLLSRERLAAAQRRLAESEARPQVGWSAGVRHLESIDENALVASFSVPLGARQRARPAIREAEALASKAALDIESARIEAVASLYGLYQELAHARTEFEVLRGTIQPRTEEVLRSTGEAFRQGRAGFLELANAQQQLLAFREQALGAAAAYHGLLIEIERLTGTAMAGEAAASGEYP